MVYIVAGLYIVSWLFLTQTRAGARLQAVGGNAEAVRRVGISANTYRILGFVLGATCGALAGLATVATTRQAISVGVGQPAVLPRSPPSPCPGCHSPVAGAASPGCSSAR